jgi:dihydroorotate dehydrogenase (fumarate)/dihydropyrimidine dehydrogenase (NAD+) subunit PreA
VHRIHTEPELPVTGSNGIHDYRDVVEFIMAGALLVQVGSVLMLKGIKYLPRIIDGLRDFMEAHGYPNVDSMTGIASRASVRDYGHQFRKPRMPSEIDRDACKNPKCTICIQTCSYDALAQVEGLVNRLHKHVIGCEIYTQTCPFNATGMHQTTAEQRCHAPFFDIPEGVYGLGKFEKGFVRGIKLPKVCG